MAKKSPTRKKGMHKLAAISEEMQQWCAALEAELATWLKVVSKPMFGMTAYYVGEQIFAVLPKTKAFFAPKAIGIRTESLAKETLEELARDSRSLNNPIGKKWVSFQVDGAPDLRAAIQWLSEAYEASRRKPSKPKRLTTKKKNSNRR